MMEKPNEVQRTAAQQSKRKETELRWYHKLSLVVILVFVGVVAYGLATDCPGAVGYHYCSPAERHNLKFGR